ncbi:MAG: aspartate-semialdehyde dehydrogenase [Pseudomonadota bacterium]|jgi:aspartate-semialdehyde dehydrogenase
MRIPVAILGATGMVGQRFAQRLARHPRFEVVALAASDRSAGRPYADAAPWRLDGEAPFADLPLRPCTPEDIDAPVVFSALDSSVARETEAVFRDAGRMVVSNTSAWRMAEDVPLVIPEVNPDHVEIVRGRRGAIVCNPNCTSMPLVFALAPLHAAFGVEAVAMASWQAVSGAGYPGESAWDMLGNVHPHAGDEEAKLAEEPRRILGHRDGTRVVHAPFPISARCVRVPVVDGHLVSAQVKLRGEPSVGEVEAVLRAWRPAARLPSTPEPLLRFSTRRDRPAPRPDADAGDGMAVTLGRIEPCEVFTVKLFALAHNAIRGAAGGAVAVAELLEQRGLLPTG